MISTRTICLVLFFWKNILEKTSGKQFAPEVCSTNNSSIMIQYKLLIVLTSTSISQDLVSLRIFFMGLDHQTVKRVNPRFHVHHKSYIENKNGGFRVSNLCLHDENNIYVN